jgi:uncharacterized protein Usg
MVSDGFRKKVLGYGLTTAQILYRTGSSLAAADLCRAELRSVSEIPGTPGFPRLLAGKTRWPLHSVTVVHSRLIKPAEFRAIDGLFRLH